THTTLDEKKHGPEHRKGVCCRGKLTDHGRYRCRGIRRYALVGSCLPDLIVYNLCCSLWVAPSCNGHYYGNVRTHTLLDKKEHDSKYRKGVCCQGKLTDRGRYQRGGIRRYALGCHQGVLRAIRCTFCRAGYSQSLSSYSTLQFRTRYSYTWPESVLLPDSFTTVVTIGNSRSASSRGGVVSVFARSCVVLEAGVGCTDSTLHEKHRAVVC
ncbi:unnamed protein product, partial [Ascophyllum nodosum]